MDYSTISQGAVQHQATEEHIAFAAGLPKTSDISLFHTARQARVLPSWEKTKLAYGDPE